MIARSFFVLLIFSYKLSFGLVAIKTMLPLTRLAAETERVHLVSTLESKTDDPVGNTYSKGFAILTEYIRASTNTTIVACEGTLNNSRSRLEIFGIHSTGLNYSKLVETNEVFLVERIYDLRNESTLQSLQTLFRSQKLLASARTFPPSEVFIDGDGGRILNEIRAFENKLLGHARRIARMRNVERISLSSGISDSGEDVETTVVREFLCTQQRDSSATWMQYVSEQQNEIRTRGGNATLQIALIKEFLQWFRDEFPYYYSQCQRPECRCSNENEYLGFTYPRSEEVQYQAALCELFICSSCKEVSRFPRYNDLTKMLATRRGRCGEYSVLVMKMLQLLGYRARWVVDWADHVWAEVEINNEWIHTDPCEASINENLIYQGWGKNQTYIFAIGTDGEVEDVTLSYTTAGTDVVEQRRDAVGVNTTQVNILLDRARMVMREQI